MKILFFRKSYFITSCPEFADDMYHPEHPLEGTTS